MKLKSVKQKADIKQSIYLNTFDTYDFFNKYTASYGVIFVTLIKITCDKHHYKHFV